MQSTPVSPASQTFKKRRMTVLDHVMLFLLFLVSLTNITLCAHVALELMSNPQPIVIAGLVAIMLLTALSYGAAIFCMVTDRMVDYHTNEFQ